MSQNIRNKARQNLVDMYLKSLEEDIVPWQQEWQSKQPINGCSSRKYKGINNAILSYVASKRGYKDHRWCTYNQVMKKKWNFKGSVKGKGVLIQYWSAYNYKEKRTYNLADYNKVIRENPELKNDFRIIDKCTRVYNGDLIEGIPKLKEENLDINKSEFINNLITKLGVQYIETGNRAYYQSFKDLVVIPPVSTFKHEYGYYSTQLHELAHSTGHEKRLNRDLSGEYGSQSYAKEELRAEIGSSFLMQNLGLKYDEKHLENHKAYIQSWIQLLKEKPTELFKAISDAEKIYDYMQDLTIEKNINLTQENEMEDELEYE